MTARVVSVNVGRPREIEGLSYRTAIDKRPVEGRVPVGRVALEGDEVADTQDHGGPYQAVYAFAQEDLDLWTERLGAPCFPGLFGENLTTAGLDVNDALIGERWRVGSTLLEVDSVRIPCSTFTAWMISNGFDGSGWVRRFATEGRCGPYLRVVEPGQVRAGDSIEVVERPDHDVTVAMLFRALTTERTLMSRLPGLERLDPRLRAKAEAYVVRHGERPGRAG